PFEQRLRVLDGPGRQRTDPGRAVGTRLELAARTQMVAQCGREVDQRTQVATGDRDLGEAAEVADRLGGVVEELLYFGGTGVPGRRPPAEHILQGVPDPFLPPQREGLRLLGQGVEALLEALALQWGEPPDRAVRRVLLVWPVGAVGLRCRPLRADPGGELLRFRHRGE